MNETTPAPMPIEIPSGDLTPRTQVRWPLIGALTAILALAIGALALGRQLASYERVFGAAERAIDDGGLLSRGSFRRMLGKLEINCRRNVLPDGTEGLACKASVPEEAY